MMGKAHLCTMRRRTQLSTGRRRERRKRRRLLYPVRQRINNPEFLTLGIGQIQMHRMLYPVWQHKINYRTQECLDPLCLWQCWTFFSPVIREIHMRGAVQKPTKYWGTKQSQLGDEKSGNLSPSKQNWLGKNQELFVIGHEPNVWGIALIMFIIAIWSNHYCGIRALGHWGYYIFNNFC